MPNAAFSQIVNRSMSEVIVRSLATSFCSVLPVMGLFFFGGETLKAFAFALIVGTLSGTYSSVFIAAPLLSHWKSREAVYTRRESRIRQEFGGLIPAYAVAMPGVPLDVEPKRASGRRGRVTSPEDPMNVSRDEFNEMVREIGTVEDTSPTGARAASAPRPAPAGGRRARRANGEAEGDVPPPKPINPASRKVTRKHGRSR
jgi:SecD/SecF fusion protein